MPAEVKWNVYHAVASLAHLIINVDFESSTWS